MISSLSLALARARRRLVRQRRGERVRGRGVSLSARPRSGRAGARERERARERRDSLLSVALPLSRLAREKAHAPSSMSSSFLYLASPRSGAVLSCAVAAMAAAARARAGETQALALLLFLQARRGMWDSVLSRWLVCGVYGSRTWRAVCVGFGLLCCRSCLGDCAEGEGVCSSCRGGGERREAPRHALCQTPARAPPAACPTQHN